MSSFPTTDTIADLAQTRDEAARLLEDLIAARAASESRLAGRGAKDPMRSVTGRSAYDDAIRATQEVLARAEAALHAGRTSVDRPLISNADRRAVMAPSVAAPAATTMTAKPTVETIDLAATASIRPRPVG